MGTLTAAQDRLPEYCEHKLPTSCRLSSIPNCCACADERAHAASYSTYIDGIGFVPRGNRWQRYCWFCKEFWENRVEASGLRPPQTRIPLVPDQSEFLEKWYEFHQGYRLVKKEDGVEERVAVLGEDFKEVSPGQLPRTLEEMRAGRRRAEGWQQARHVETRNVDQAGPSLEDTLEQMFEAASIEETQATNAPRAATAVPARVELPTQAVTQPETMQRHNIHAQAMNPAASRNREYQLRRVAGLRRELNRMRNGIERVIHGLRDLGEEVPSHAEAADSLTALDSTLDTISGPSREQAEVAMSSVNALTSLAAGQSQPDRTLATIQIRVSEARDQLEETRRVRDRAASELDLAESEFRSSQQRLQQLQREQRTTENYMRIFGTREEMVAQGDNYESPIGGMFSRAEARFRAAEESRAEERTLREVLASEAAAGGEDEARRLAELEARERDVWGVPWPQNRAEPTTSAIDTARVPAGLRTGPQPFERDSEYATPVHMTPTNDEAMLEEYYAMIRQQDWQRQTDGAGTDPVTAEEHAAASVSTANFPHNMLNAIRAARERELTEGESPLQSSRTLAEDDITTPPTSGFHRDLWWHQDAGHIIRRLTTNDELRGQLNMTPQDASVLLTYFINDEISELDRATIDGLLRNPVAIWRTGLPAEWLQRRRDQLGDNPVPESLFFHTQAAPQSSIERAWSVHHDHYLQLEIVAQAFQMSAEVRRNADDLTPPERLQMLYRLQAGQRTDRDIVTLGEIRNEPRKMQMVLTIYGRSLRAADNDEISWPRRRNIDDQRRAMARDGNHSRAELDSRRRETARAFALAAGRQAMRTGSDAVIEQMAARDATERENNPEGARAAFIRRITTNYLNRDHPLSDYLTEASSESESEEEGEPEPQGLDATDSGRPEPKSDEELSVQMECKVCYTQLAEIACLPCGHLVMCKWCSEQHSPTLQHDRTRPRRAAACPVCRKGIRQKVRVFRA